jgi:hypothetical protein
LTTATE